MRTVRMLVGVIALTALTLVAGCSSVSAPGRSPAQEVRDAIMTTVGAGPARVALSSRTSVAGQDVDVTGAGLLDLRARTADLQLRVPLLGGAIRTVFLGGIVYGQVPAQLAVFAGGKPWVSIDLDRVGQQQLGASLRQLGVGTSGNPATQLDYLQGIRDDAREVGPEPVDGVPATHYSAVVDLDRTPAAGDPAARPALDRLKAQLGTSTLPVEVWVDDDGRLRRVVQTVTSPPRPGVPSTTATTTVTFQEFGLDAPITAPPADQVADLGALLPAG